MANKPQIQLFIESSRNLSIFPNISEIARLDDIADGMNIWEIKGNQFRQLLNLSRVDLMRTYVDVRSCPLITGYCDTQTGTLTSTLYLSENGFKTLILIEDVRQGNVYYLHAFSRN